MEVQYRLLGLLWRLPHSFPSSPAGPSLAAGSFPQLGKELGVSQVKIETLSAGPLAHALSALSHFPLAPPTSPIALRVPRATRRTLPKVTSGSCRAIVCFSVITLAFV